MPSKRRQLNVRLSDEAEARLHDLRARMASALGITVSLADVFTAGLAELEKRYPSGTDGTDAPAGPPTKPATPRAPSKGAKGPAAGRKRSRGTGGAGK